MIDLLDIETFKEQYDGHKLLYVRFSNFEFIFRDISPYEYKLLNSQYMDKYDLQEAICNLSCIYPENIDFKYIGMAGVVDKAYQYIIDASGVEDPLYAISLHETLLNSYTLEEQCMDLIKAFIKDYTYEEMEKWTYTKLIEMTVKAERISKLQGFDWHISNQKEEYENEMSKVELNNEEFNDILINKGISPIMFYRDSIQEKLKNIQENNINDQPIITNMNLYKNEELVNGVQQQIKRRFNKEAT